ncbi:hypothetical protein [Demequina salsinemoris]|uniref:hypothetical protein n=1 Tax=Demequina salsinemoris TaxID=577470 RepID=UPI00078197BC|nr:hypothetical protein [Demequina salsinemoris]
MTSVLDEPSPITGDPPLIDAQARRLGGVADALAVTIAELRAIRAGTVMRGEAIAAYLEAAEVIEQELGLVESRYAATSAALAGYAASLAGFQAEGEDLRRRAAYAHTAIAWADQRIAAEQADIGSEAAASAGAGMDAVLIPALRGQTAAERERADAAAALAACERQLDELRTRWAAIAEARASEIDCVIEASALNDSGWDVLIDRLEWLLDEAIPWVETALDVIALVAAVAAVVLVLTGVGAPLASALFVISRLAQAGARIVTVIKAVTTSTLVATGRRPVSALADLGTGLVLDRVGGKAGDIVVARAARGAPAVVSGALDRVGSGAVALTGRVSPSTAAVGVAAVRLRVADYDSWIGERLDANMSSVMGRPTVADPAGFSATFDAWTDSVVADALDMASGGSVGAAYTALLAGIDSAAGPQHALSGVAYQVVDVAREIEGRADGGGGHVAQASPAVGAPTATTSTASSLDHEEVPA